MTANVASRKNMWETGKVAGSTERKTHKSDIIGADFSSRKNLWLKATEGSGGIKKTVVSFMHLKIY